MTVYTLLDATGTPCASPVPGTLGGHRRARIYGRLDCPSALRAIAAGGYVRDRVFFADEATALAAGYRPCGVPAGALPHMEVSMITHTVLDSPLDDLTVIADDGVLTGLYFAGHWGRPDPEKGVRDDAAFAEVARQLGEYFAGTRTSFDVPLRADGDDFQRAVWAEVAKVPTGGTTTYGDIAAAVGAQAREVGAAVGANPLCVLVPCHRVVGAGGKLTGYAGGLRRKRFLLDLEDRGQLW
jgi:methylated-DNA-[protein]-cysteine S-methyltransferase